MDPVEGVSARLGVGDRPYIHVRFNAACRLNGFTYSKLIAGLKKAEISLNRKVLADLAVNDAAAFTALCEKVKNA